MKSTSRHKTLRRYVDAQPRQKTQGDIAKELGLSDSQLSMYLSGSRVPSRETALRLARDFGFSLESLLAPLEAQAS